MVRNLYSELIQNYWPEEKKLALTTSDFENLETITAKQKFHVYAFNIASNTATNFQRIKDFINTSALDKSRVIIASEVRPPDIETEREIEIIYCQEARFTSECINHLIEYVPTYSS